MPGATVPLPNAPGTVTWDSRRTVGAVFKQLDPLKDPRLEPQLRNSFA